MLCLVFDDVIFSAQITHFSVFRFVFFCSLSNTYPYEVALAQQITACFDAIKSRNSNNRFVISFVGRNEAKLS